MGNRNEALYHLAVKTGMRKDELLGLKWFDLEWNSRYLRILRQAQRVPGEGIKFVDPNTRAGKRTTPLGRTMLQILSEHKRKQQLGKAVAGERWKENNLVFRSSIGTPQSDSNLLKEFRSLLEKAGLPKIRFHNLRHTAASIMLNNGRNFIEVSKMLGHSQPSTTMNTYAHLIPVMHNDMGDFMDDLITPIPIEMGETSNQTMIETGKKP